MKKEVAEKWVVALRSGKYKQGSGTLQGIARTYCCLGVLCEIAPANKKLIAVDGMLLGSNLATQPDVKDWADMATSLGSLYTNTDREISLAMLNDSGKTFEEIADIIEKNWEKL
jgi:hypothetical protein